MVTTEETQAALAQIEQMHEVGALPTDSFHKCIVTLASEHLCRRHDPERALILLNRVPPDYYKQTLVSQMEDDTLFAEVVFEMGYRVVQLGIADGEPVRPTQLPAEA